ncbi:MAG: type II secretion system GspH family protein [Rhodocyclaceae bacterium]|nr:type II secretion system GspH family protein [Rhodocyclaceae bacterium]
MCIESRQQGLTLVELIVFIVVLGAALAGVLLVFNQVTARSADPLVRKQMIAIAESLLEEIEARPYFCPNGATCDSVTPMNRANTHAVADYNGFDMTGIRAIDGASIPQLDAYKVSVTVTPQPLNGANGSLIAITVKRGSESLTLKGWRGAY